MERECMSTTMVSGTNFDYEGLPLVKVQDRIELYQDAIQRLLDENIEWEKFITRDGMMNNIAQGKFNVWLYGSSSFTGIILWSLSINQLTGDMFIDLVWTYGDFSSQRAQLFSQLEYTAMLLGAKYIETSSNPVWVHYMTSKLGYEIESIKVRKPVNQTKGMH